MLAKCGIYEFEIFSNSMGKQREKDQMTGKNTKHRKATRKIDIFVTRMTELPEHLESKNRPKT